MIKRNSFFPGVLKENFLFSIYKTKVFVKLLKLMDNYVIMDKQRARGSQKQYQMWRDPVRFRPPAGYIVEDVDRDYQLRKEILQ